MLEKTTQSGQRRRIRIKGSGDEMSSILESLLDTARERGLGRVEELVTERLSTRDGELAACAMNAIEANPELGGALIQLAVNRGVVHCHVWSGQTHVDALVETLGSIDSLESFIIDIRSVN